MKKKVKKISKKVRHLIDWFKNRNWRKAYRIASYVLFVVAMVGSICYTSIVSYDMGEEHGRRVGQCEVGCAVLDMEYSFYDEDDTCWCAAGPNAYYAVPLRKDF
tara:strand:- start:374 stop:685 length:312 start_codon:yes stop_codon:yes gene_type:complete